MNKPSRSKSICKSSRKAVEKQGIHLPTIRSSGLVLVSTLDRYSTLVPQSQSLAFYILDWFDLPYYRMCLDIRPINANANVNAMVHVALSQLTLSTMRKRHEHGMMATI